MFPGYTIGPDAYDDIVSVCPACGRKVAIIGGKRALDDCKAYNVTHGLTEAILGPVLCPIL